MTTTLKNCKIQLAIDPASGGILSIIDPVRNVVYPFSKNGFALYADGDVYFANAEAKETAVTADGAEYLFTDRGFTARLRYFLTKDGAFIERELSFCRENEAWTADSILCEDTELPAAPAHEILFHDDQTLWHVPMNYFIRYDGGGLFCGLEYPYWDLQDTAGDCIRLRFSPRCTVNAGEWFTAEKTFWGVYTAEGIFRHSHGPYPGKDKLPYHAGLYQNNGLGQHFAGDKVPEDVGMPEEILDWGEVWAMQAFMRHHLPLQPLPEEGFWVWQNGWWAQLFTSDPAKLEPLACAGVRDIMTASMYYGHDNHPNTEPKYIRDMRIDPPGFPVYARSEEGVSEGTEGLHSMVKNTASDNNVIDYTDTFEAPPAFDAFVREAKKMGIHVSSFCTPNNAYSNRPEWLALHEDGSAHEYFGSKLSCPACDEYMDFQYEMLTRVLDRYKPRFWGFDGRWLNYRELAGYHFKTIGVDPCFHPGHGHPVGDSRYKEWKNIEKFKAKLRKRYPNMCLEQYYGLKRGGVWSMCNLNADENYYEIGTIANNRHQTWHNENSRFRPVYINYSSIVGSTPAEFEHSMISTLSTSYYAQLAGGYTALQDYPETAEIYRKWKNWADENHKYLADRRCLFGMPGEFAADGSAHFCGDTGLLFLFTAPEAYADLRIPFTRWLGLTENPDARYRISIITAVHQKGEEAFCTLVSDVVRYGETLRCRVSPNTAVILRAEPTEEIGTVFDVTFAEDDAVAEAFPR